MLSNNEGATPCCPLPNGVTSLHCLIDRFITDDILDEDVISTYPLIRSDRRLPRLWFHR